MIGLFRRGDDDDAVGNGKTKRRYYFICQNIWWYDKRQNAAVLLILSLITSLIVSLSTYFFKSILQKQITFNAQCVLRWKLYLIATWIHSFMLKLLRMENFCLENFVVDSILKKYISILWRVKQTKKLLFNFYLPLGWIWKLKSSIICVIKA